ncbi:MAG: cardiolipin synthase ClsB, partial [Myxococcales bacterium]|nr:cardiolipin synthase ClsB [Myxococcales bacterium]
MKLKRLRTSGKGEGVGVSVAGNCVTLLHDPEVCLPAMLNAICKAQHEVLLEMYWFASDRTGWEFAEALCDRARAGVRVRVIYDAAGSIMADDEMFHRMRREGCQVAEYNPIAPWRARFQLGLLNNRDHRKMVVVDGHTALAGGVNLGDEWASTEAGGEGWRDDVIQIEGPAALALREVFTHTWRDLTGVSLPPHGGEVPTTDPSAGSAVRALANHFRDERKAIRQAYLDRIGRATRYLYLTNSYFVPDRKVRRALADAAKRGVDVRVLLPAASDVPAVDFASRYLWGGLMAGGIKLYRFHGPVLHAKSAVSDDLWTTVGSFNLDYRSWRTNLELNVSV